MGDIRRTANFTGINLQEELTTLSHDVHWDMRSMLHNRDGYYPGKIF